MEAFAVVHGCQSCHFLEHAVEIGLVFKSQLVGDFFYRCGFSYQFELGIFDSLFIDVCQWSHVDFFFEQSDQVVFRKA